MPPPSVTDVSPTAPLIGTSLDFSSKIPIYHQLYEILRARIVGGEWQPDQLLPTDPQLMDYYGVSRITVRQALNNLVNEGLIFRQRGRGTFIAQVPVANDVGELVTFEEDMRRRGMVPETRVLQQGLVPVSVATAEKLNMQIGEELAGAQLLRLADGLPLYLDDCLVVHKLFPGILDKFDFATTPVITMLEQSYGVRLTRSIQTVAAVEAVDEQVKLLQNANRPLLLRVERIGYSQNNIPVLFERLYYRADRYMLRYEQRR